MNKNLLFFLMLFFMIGILNSIRQCENYILESGNFDVINFQNITYAFLKPLEHQNNDTCYNDFSFGGKWFFSNYGPTIISDKFFHNPSPYLISHTLPSNLVSIAWFSQNLKNYSSSLYNRCHIHLCNTSHSCVEFKSGYHLRFYNNTINGTPTDGYFYIKKVELTTDLGGGSTCDAPEIISDIFQYGNFTSKTFWATNVSGFINGLINTSQERYKNQTLSKLFLLDMDNRERYIYILTPQGFGGFYSFNVTNNSTFKANVLSSGGGQLLQPKFMFILNGLPSKHIPIDNPTNLSDYTIRLVPNKASVLIDNFQQCYFLPAYNPYNLSQIQTLTAYPMQCDATLQHIDPKAFEYVPLFSLCRAKGENYHINITFLGNVTFEEFFTDYNNTMSYNSFSASEFHAVKNLTNFTKYELKTNGKLRCSFDVNSKSIFGIQLFPGTNNYWRSSQGGVVKQIVVVPFFLAVTGVSLLNPFAIVFNIAVNDWFQVLPPDTLAFMIILTGIMSVMINWQGERSLKTLVIYLLLGGTYLLYIHSLAPFAGPETSELENVIQSFRTLFGNVKTDIDIITIITYIIPLFLINFVLLILKLPAIVVNLIFVSLGQIFPQGIAYFGIFEAPLIVSAYAFILLKLYEIGRNMFRQV